MKETKIPERFLDDNGMFNISPEWALVIVILELIEALEKVEK